MQRVQDQQLQGQAPHGSPASFSTPLPGATVYRPGGALAFTLALTPALGACGAAAVFLMMRSAIPLWLPGALVGWALLTPLFWLALKTVRVSPYGVASGRPWQVWREIPWGGIAQVERRGLRLRVTSRDGVRVSFNPGLLYAGAELRRYLLTRVSPELLDDALSDEARRMAMAESGPAYPGPLPSILRARPRLRSRLLCALATLAALCAVPVAALELPLTLGLPLAAAALALGFGGMLGFAWLSQQVTLSETGISVIAFPSGRARRMQWSQVVLLEYTRHGRVIRLTGQGQEERVRCPGPSVMRPLDAAVYRAFLKRQLRDRPVMEARRFWLA
jgi:hypothetical protein